MRGMIGIMAGCQFWSLTIIKNSVDNVKSDWNIIYESHGCDAFLSNSFPDKSLFLVASNGIYKNLPKNTFNIYLISTVVRSFAVQQELYKVCQPGGGTCFNWKSKLWVSVAAWSNE